MVAEWIKVYIVLQSRATRGNIDLTWLCYAQGLSIFGGGGPMYIALVNARLADLSTGRHLSNDRSDVTGGENSHDNVDDASTAESAAATGTIAGSETNGVETTCASSHQIPAIVSTARQPSKE